MAQTWQEISKQKRSLRDSLIPQEWRLKSLPSEDTLNVTDVPRTCGILSEHELDITENYDATALAQAIRAKKLTCVDVTVAYCKRAAIAQQLINCLTEILFEDAIRRAKALDHHLERYGTPVGPLHGVPISLKDTFKLPGYDSSLGIAAFSLNPAQSTTPLASILLSAGAVFYVKTNVPQTMMALDSENNIFGRTLNPVNKLVTAGGSSGGEGALVGIKGSPLGVGTDIGGSIRIPAMCNGLYGLKPSANRVPYSGQQGMVPEGSSALSVSASAGPIARSNRDIELFFSTVSDAKPWERDPHVIPGLWQTLDQSIAGLSGSDSGTRPLTIGILSSDGLALPLPPIQKILKEVSDKLSKAPNLRVVPVPTPPRLSAMQKLATDMFSMDGNKSYFELLDAYNEPLTTWLKPILRRGESKTLNQARELHALRETLMREMLGMWKTADGTNTEIDAIICPVAPHPVPPLDSWGGASYTTSFVMLDYPAANLPVRAFVESDMEGEMPAETISSYDKLNRRLWDKSQIDRKVYLGTSLSVQVLAPRLQERRLFRAMEAIDKVLHPQAPAARL